MTVSINLGHRSVNEPVLRFLLALAMRRRCESMDRTGGGGSRGGGQVIAVSRLSIIIGRRLGETFPGPHDTSVAQWPALCLLDVGIPLVRLMRVVKSVAWCNVYLPWL